MTAKTLQQISFCIIYATMQNFCTHQAHPHSHTANFSKKSIRQNGIFAP